MTDPGEVSAFIITLFIGIITVGATYATVYGGDVTRITQIASTLAVPVVILALAAFFLTSILEAI